jgi:hypothetical protein
MDKKTAAVSFGAALATLGVAGELQADIISLSFNPGSIGTDIYGPQGVSVLPIGATFSQWNDSVGKTLYAGFYGNGFSSIDYATAGQTIDPATFVGTSFLLAFSASATGTQYVAFRYNGNVGWFAFDAGGFLGNIKYLQGQYGDMGETVRVPAPTSGLALLALGAAGLRRKRVA